MKTKSCKISIDYGNMVQLGILLISLILILKLLAHAYSSIASFDKLDIRILSTSLNICMDISTFCLNAILAASFTIAEMSLVRYPLVVAITKTPSLPQLFNWDRNSLTSALCPTLLTLSLRGTRHQTRQNTVSSENFSWLKQPTTRTRL